VVVQPRVVVVPVDRDARVQLRIRGVLRQTRLEIDCIFYRMDK
jgi:hypothetical protein